ncbi:MAG: hypothetical protein ACOYNZ_06665 [Rhodoferax sp.]
MIFQNLFGSRAESANWDGVVQNLSGTLWHLLNDDPQVLASPYARVVLRADGAVGIASDRRDAKKLLDIGDLAFVFLQEHPVAVKAWIDGLRRNLSGASQKNRTEDFARVLVEVLMKEVGQRYSGVRSQQA